mmetsp:Transcript_43452/g.64449  ORF Transcript_43452/g.64449 Transcript_43452/m.64449 type:complete len:406 (-) Transcript_43452:147-1364(-)|eukprot:CAMPEP_0194055890 /NCGR_PEP_ID=MMETSP0009_2-20130614/58303_1 /TAXON_ID=210454 /ORGANISM="Grammatophora oceanica, Strain CCMP 410" /LENGTH=405 /DNA_ID=CAMNT_0038704991 /DNA_START=30 /DNA_END=1247 /DNA_ORIENTATION=+
MPPSGADPSMSMTLSSFQRAKSSNELVDVEQPHLELNGSHGSEHDSKGQDVAAKPSLPSDGSSISAMGFKVLCLLAVQNCSKSLFMRYIMKDQPDFLKSAAVIASELVKLTLSVLFIVLYERRSLVSILQFLREDTRSSLLLVVPATAYNFQMTMEYVALENLDASIFSVVVQLKLLATASFAAFILRKKLKIIQILSLVLLTTGVMLINLKNIDPDGNIDGKVRRGIIATLSIALSSGFASVYTEKVIKAKRNKAASTSIREKYSLAYMQVQLALVSLIVIGFYACIMDAKKIAVQGLWHNFTVGAFMSSFNAGIGGLIVAAVLKYADSVLKGYATAVSVILTGILSRLLFHTQLSGLYALGIVNVVVAVLLYNGKNLDRQVGCGGRGPVPLKASELNYLQPCT